MDFSVILIFVLFVPFCGKMLLFISYPLPARHSSLKWKQYAHWYSLEIRRSECAEGEGGRTRVNICTTLKSVFGRWTDLGHSDEVIAEVLYLCSAAAAVLEDT